MESYQVIEWMLVGALGVALISTGVFLGINLYGYAKLKKGE